MKKNVQPKLNDWLQIHIGLFLTTWALPIITKLVIPKESLLSEIKYLASTVLYFYRSHRKLE